ncbi:MAG: radical SAM protein [Dehalococcoidales bacterium]|nr:radical SAM protein [Dehalococcoidales bacterium]
MLTGLHFLITYTCNLECDHCFLYSGPKAQGTFTLNQIQQLLDEAIKIGTVERIYFEGGEPFLYYPIMLEGIKMARGMGFQVGVVTNAYFATAEEDIEIWLKPLYKLGIADLSISNDSYHYEDERENPAIRARNVARKLNMPVAEIHIEKPLVTKGAGEKQAKGEPVIGGSTMLRGRAVEKLIAGLPLRYWQEFTECPYEDLESPKRVHLDPYGNVHLCQGLSMGNAWGKPLSKMVKDYDAGSHPICSPLVRGGPALLAKEYQVEHEDKYVDACHFCYVVRLKLLDRFPQYLTPKQVYGLE